MPLSDRARAIVFALAPSVVAVAVFAPAIGYDFVNWDDEHHVTSNPAVTGGEGISSRQFWYPSGIGYPIPVTLLTYMANHAIHGLDPTGYHLVNILLHAMCVFLVGVFMRQVGLTRVGALAAALVFAVHPIVVEPVAWVTGRKDLLAALFMLASACVWNEAAGSKRRVAVSALLFVLSFLSKQSALFVPLLWLVPALWTSRRREAAVSFAVWIASVAALGAVLVFAPPLGWSTSFESTTIFARVLRTVGGHIALLFSPGDLLPRYILPAPTLTEWRSLLGAAAIGAVVALSSFPRTRRHVATRFVLFAALAFVPVAGLFRNPRDMVDSYLYLPFAGLVGLVGCAVESSRRRLAVSASASRRVFGVLSVVALPATLLPWTVAQTGVWRNGETLWSYALSVYPDSPQVCRSYGNALYFKERFVDALNVYERCAKMHQRPEVFESNIRVTRERLRFERERAISR